jgi:dTDP-4-amino-4,6-dideoxygalactose transaminase
VDKYTWVDLGSSYVLSDILAAFLCAQLEQRDWIQTVRKRIWDAYYEGLHDWAKQNGVRLPAVPADCEQSYHMFYLLLPTRAARDALIAHLKARGMLAVFHYVPLHLSEMGQRWGGRPGQCPVAEQVSERLLRLPFYNDLTPANQAEIIEAVCEFRC